VSGFRRALWKEHIGRAAPEADDPSTLECARWVKHVADANWVAWARDDRIAAPEGHLLTYPLAVSQLGAVGAAPGAEEFPDLGGRVLGGRVSGLPTLLTT
jgi:phospholipase D1/2